MKNMTKMSVRFGEGVLFFLRLQFYWILTSISLGLITGIMPATSAVYYYLFQSFQQKELYFPTFKEFRKKSKESFKGSNLLGGSQILVLLILWIDLRVNAQFIANPLLHGFLIACSALVLGVSTYLLPSFVRYKLQMKDYYKQAFYLFLSNLINTVAMVFGIFVVSVVFVLFPLLSLVATIPLLLLPIAWFSFKGMTKIEENAKKV
ncbi:MAG: DUF624 domain-containing protein [Lactobacillales bacterium]|nr:DUF624 domain-containing protein [Lactobacillales bacterium]